jgi:hypothetical protein
MRRTISSWQTFLVKWVAGPFAIASCAFGVVAAWTGCFDKPGRPPTPAWVGAACLAIMTILIAQCIWFVRHVRRIQVDDDFLYVSDHPSEIRVPLADIASVRQTGWRGPLIAIYFVDESPVASPVYFIARRDWSYWPLFGVHPIVDDLEWLRDEARRKSNANTGIHVNPWGMKRGHHG